MTAADDARRQLRRARRRARRGLHRAQRRGRRAERGVRVATARGRRALRPLWRDLAKHPRAVLADAAAWADRARRDVHRGDLRPVALLLLFLTFALLPLQNIRLTSGVAIADVFLVAAAGASLLVRHPRPPALPLPHLLRDGLALMAVGAAVGLAFADERLVSAKLVVRLVVVVALAFVAVLRIAPSGREVRQFLVAMVAVGAVSGVVSAFGDVTGLPPFDRSTFGDRAVGLTLSPYPLIDELRGTATQSIATNPNLFGGVSAVAGAVALVLLTEAKRWPTRVLLALGAGGLFAGVLFSGSRSSLVAFVVGCVPTVWRLVRRGYGRHVLAGAGLLGVALLVTLATSVSAPSLDRLLLRPDSPDAERTAESTILRYQNATRGLEARGWHSLATGSGLRDDPRSALHDGHLELWVGLGLIGLIGWILVCTGIIEGGVRYAGRDGPLTARETVLLALASGFLANVVVTLFVDTLWNRYIWLLAALVVTLLVRPDGVEAPAAVAPGRKARTTASTAAY